jgi:hypothetical protein
MFVEGVSPIDEQAVNEWLEIAEECAVDSVEDGASDEDLDEFRPDWDDLLNDFYGPKVR